MKLALLIALGCSAALAQSFPAAPAFPTAAELDSTISQSVREDKIPGAVLLIGHDGAVVYRKAYGERALVPVREAMTVDTIFDIASLTKIVATTSALMKLYDEGRFSPDDLVTKYLPEFQGGHSPITIRDLMTHYSGLRPDLELKPAWSGYETGIHRALTDKPAGPPEVKFVYSDINFELLGEIVHRLSGMPENDYVRKILFEPLGMKDTGYLPSPSLRPRIAPTEMQDDGAVLRGVVHDPTARYMGGVAGHAGVFSTADDLAKFCQMILDDGAGLFHPETVKLFTSAASPKGQANIRGLGWDIDSVYSGNRGNLFPVGHSFGHTGFTGTSIWIDPQSKTYVILLANSVHPHVRPAITPLRRIVATLAAEGVGYSGVLTGLDILEASNFKELRGRKIGLITNQTGMDRNGKRNVDLMVEAGLNVVALFSPEHGFAGVEDRPGIENTTDPKTGLRIWSLYGSTNRPTPAMLAGIDTLVFDIQDVGVRFYTYESTMLYAMEEAAKAKIRFVVLDRPNPITGNRVEGPMLDKDQLSFVGAFPLPLRHGMTIGELARLENSELDLGADLQIVQMTGWKRDQWFDFTALPWVNPSPNIRNLNEAILYPALAMLEYSPNYSVGRGTSAPFEQIGADWIDGAALAAEMNARAIPGVRFHPVQFTPASSNFSGKTIQGIGFELTDRDRFSATTLGTELALALGKLYPGRIKWDASLRLIGNRRTMSAFESSASEADTMTAAQSGIAAFQQLRAKYLLYR
ncbi:MAG TPA: exo-beta-N-acetylmuramidase NamZ domain-containing protein [Bryobacteraceae bacterium]|nr:exo-beta-N-acetylmuramidase NamZ domain-containing protein [Bryobacteraceae bacterium]